MAAVDENLSAISTDARQSGSREEINMETEDCHKDAESATFYCDPSEEKVKFSLTYLREKHSVEASLDLPVVEFRKMVHELTGVPPAMQKLMCKGPMKDGMTLRDAKVAGGCKVMLVGSTLHDIMAVNTKPTKEQMSKTDEKPANKEPLCKQKVHAKVIEKGVPEDALPGIKNAKSVLKRSR